MTRPLRAALALLLALAAAGGAAAQGSVTDEELARLRAGEGAGPIGTRCVTPGAVLEIAGVGRAVYDTVEVDSAAGSARLAGGVCIEVPEVDLVLRASSFEITGLNGPTPVIAAARARLDVGAWRLTVTALEGPVADLALREVEVRSPGVIGRAGEGRIAFGEDGPEGVLRLVALATHDYRLDARTARLLGDVLVLEEAAGTSCVCGAPIYVLHGDSVLADLSGTGARVRGPVLEVLGVRIGLGEELEFREDGPALELPFAVAGREDLGTIAIVRGRPAAGLRVELGAATEPVPWPLALLDARAEGDRLRLEVDGRGLFAEARRERPLGGGAYAAFLSETVLRGDDPRLRAGGELGWRSGDLTPDAPLRTELTARAGAEVAAEPAGVADDARPFGAGAAGVRLPFAATLSAAAPVADGLRAELRAGASGALYPTASEPGRVALRLAPSLTAQAGGARLTLGAERRWALGDGPFGFDDVGDRARLTAEAALPLGPFRAEARAAWRFAPERPGAEQLRLRVTGAVPLADGWLLEPALRGEFAGLAGGDADEDWLEAELAFARGEDLRLSLRAREGLDPVELRELVLGARAPLALRHDLVVAPYLAVDLAGGVRVHGHGLRVYAGDCCGQVVLGYRTEGDETTFELDLRLPPLDLGEPPLPESVLRDVPLTLPDGALPPGGDPARSAPPGGDPARDAP